VEKWWARSGKEVVLGLQTDIERGLSGEEVKRRLRKYGKNKIADGKGNTPFKVFLRQFANPLVILLVVAAAVSAALGNSLDATLIIAIVVINGIFGFIQEYRAEKAIEALRKMGAPRARVVRDGSIVMVPAEELVPGDVIILQEGDVVSADVRLLDTRSLRVDESMLTGESLPVEKTEKKIREDAPLQERRNMVYMGTFVVQGQGKGIVVATGENTEMGKIAESMRAVQRRKTSFEREVDELSRFIATLVGVIAAVVAVVLVVRNPSVEGFLTAVMVSVALAVAAVPEGLPAVVTVTLAIGVRRMAKRKALVRRLSAVEVLGSVDVICTDKTGTITENRMRVEETYGDVKKMAEIGYFCHTLDRGDGGDPTDIAILRWAQQFGPFEGKRVHIVPFDPEKRRMAVVVERGRQRYVYVKGAPETVLPLCSLSPDDREKIAEKVGEFADRGMRVIAMAWKAWKGGEMEKDLHFAGIVGLMDPPRRGVAEAVSRAKEAGIRVIMITGDHPRTAKAIGRRVGIEGRIITGRELDEMSDEELDKIIEDVGIFARVSPYHKPRIVEALQRRGHRVAMTGDGVNDAIALKKADIGIAMGSGTEVAREAADIVLLDNSFATIVAAIEEGRRIFHNIRAFVIYLLSANVGEVVAVFFGSILGYVILRPVQILWMNILTDGPPALAISNDPAPPDIMRRPPRRADEGILTRRDKILRIYLFGALIGAAMVGIYLMNAQNTDIARSAVLTGFVVLEMVRLDVVRDVPLWKNGYLLGSIAAVLALQLGALYSPMGEALGLYPLGIGDWLEIMGVAAATYGLARVLKI